MDSVDDDFGDLYADSEAQATSVINGVVDFTKLYIEPEYATKNDRIEAPSPKKDLVLHPEEHNSLTEESSQSANDDLAQKAASFEADASDSDDDLTILLNDEDCKTFRVSAGACPRSFRHEEDENGNFGNGAERNGSGENWKLGDGLELNSNGHGGQRGKCVNGGYNSHYKYIRSHGSAISSNIRANGFREVASLSSMSARGDLEDNRGIQFKSSGSNQVSDTCGNPSLVVSPPLYRTILNIDIDALKKKPWMCLGADITDFFNFGFDEESWKQYWKSLQQASMWVRKQVSGCPKPNWASAVGDENEEAGQAAANNNTQGKTCSEFADGRARTSCLPRGRAIQVEDAIGDRQPSMDIRRPRYRDSDVVIQIPLQDFTVDSSGSSKEEKEHTGCSIHDTSRNGNLHVDDSRNIQFSDGSGGSGDEFTAESLEEDFRIPDVSSSLRRCSMPMIASNQMSLDTDRQEHATISVMDPYNHPNMSACCSKITGAKESVDKEEKRINTNASNSDPFRIEKELSAGGLSPCSLTTCSESDTEAFRATVHGDPMETYGSRQPSPELQESDSSHYENYKRHGIKTKTENGKGHSGYGSSFQEKKKPLGEKLKSTAKSKIYPKSDDDSPLVPKRKGDSKTSVRYKSPLQFQEERTHLSHRPCLDFEQETSTKNAGSASSMSKSVAELYDRDDTSVDEGRWNGRLHDYLNKENCAYHKGKGIHCGGHERFAEKHACTVYSRYSPRKSHQSSRDDVDQYARRNCNEKGYYSRRGYTNRDTSPRTSKEYRSLTSKYSCDHKGRDAQWRREQEKLQFRKRTEYEHIDDLHRDKYARSNSFTDWMRDDTFSETYEGEFPVFERELEFSGGRDRCRNAPCLLFDRNSRGTRYTRNPDHRFFCSQSRSESCPVKGGRDDFCRNDFHKNDVKNFEVIEAYDGRRRKTHEDEGRDGWFGGCNGTEEIENSLMYKHNQVNLRRRQYSWKSGVFHCSKDEFIVKHQHDEFVTNEALLPYEEALMRDRIFSKHRFAEDERHIDDIELEHHRYKMIKSGNGYHSATRSTGLYEHEQSFLRCRDSVDLILGEVEFPRRFSNGRKVMRNGRVKNMDKKFMKQHMTSRFFNDYQREEDLRNIELKTSDERWLGEHLIKEQDENLDIEEGQIIVEELNMVDYSEIKSAPETAAHYVKRTTNHTENPLGKNNVQIDEQRILETIAKMEKRRERFKEPMSVRKEPETILHAQTEQVPDITENKQQRPARKRRWHGS